MIPAFVMSLLTSVLVLFYGYKSFKALDSTGEQDDVQWLTFWLLYSGLNFIEYFSDTLLFWLPFYYEIKFGILVYLGYFRGAKFWYDSALKSWIKSKETTIDSAIQTAESKAKGYADQAQGIVKEKAQKVANQAVNMALKTAVADKSN
eukprot:TRINITY_DN335_c0_g1_i3.p1 TRINITY_DN335_c0_g1~~TRINITY_DN335_c0_g1_i3.p1  ORF type:complete len:165 (-),score=42.82 TRINITY_DN335_c0_g1_i3:87-530(-)